MAVIGWVRMTQPHDGSADSYEVTLTAGDTSGLLVCPWKADKTFQIVGTFTGTLTLQGTLERGSNPSGWFDLVTPDGTVLSFTAAARGRAVLDNQYQYRINGTPGSGSATCILQAARGAQ